MTITPESRAAAEVAQAATDHAIRMTLSPDERAAFDLLDADNRAAARYLGLTYKEQWELSDEHRNEVRALNSLAALQTSADLRDVMGRQ